VAVDGAGRPVSGDLVELGRQLQAKAASSGLLHDGGGEHVR
jgi:hypothetical protein